MRRWWAVVRGWLRAPACTRCRDFDAVVDGLCFECLWAVTTPSQN